MPLPEYVVPVISIAGPTALLFVILWRFPHVARAVMVLLAGVAAIATKDKDRREASIKVLNALGDPPRSEPAEQRGDAIEQQDGTPPSRSLTADDK